LGASNAKRGNALMKRNDGVGKKEFWGVCRQERSRNLVIFSKGQRTKNFKVAQEKKKKDARPKKKKANKKPPALQKRTSGGAFNHLTKPPEMGKMGGGKAGGRKEPRSQKQQKKEEDAKESPPGVLKRSLSSNPFYEGFVERKREDGSWLRFLFGEAPELPRNNKRWAMERWPEGT